MHLSELNTPALILDQSRMHSNIKTLEKKLINKGVKLRPHLKTCKSQQIAKRILPPNTGGITVSTLSEAEYFLEHGYTDILYAVSISPDKLRLVKSLQNKGAVITLLLDNIETARHAANAGEELNSDFPCAIEIDCDGKRAGLTPDDPELIEIANYLHKMNRTSIAGVMTHAGGSYYCQSQDELRQMAEQERRAITTAAEKIRENNLPCPIVSMGSTPTVYFSENFEGVTEVRAGVYVFQDMVMEALNVCHVSDIAISVLATVISHKKDQNRILIDAGSLALSADPGKNNNLGETHFGKVCDMDTCTPYQDLWITSSNQEHGLISLARTSLSFDDFPIGSKVRILPNHACITAAAYPGYHITEGKSDVIDYWGRCNGW